MPTAKKLTNREKAELRQLTDEGLLSIYTAGRAPIKPIKLTWTREGTVIANYGTSKLKFQQDVTGWTAMYLNDTWTL